MPFWQVKATKLPFWQVKLIFNDPTAILAGRLPFWQVTAIMAGFHF